MPTGPGPDRGPDLPGAQPQCTHVLRVEKQVWGHEHERVAAPQAPGRGKPPPPTALRGAEPGTSGHQGGLAKKVVTPTARREVASPLQSIRSFAANSQEWAQYRYQR